MERSEAFCGWVHAVTAVLCGAMSGYNALRWTQNRKGRNAFNAALYLGGVAYELHNTRLHWAATEPTVTATEYDVMLGIGA
jgi:hypothetical protein